MITIICNSNKENVYIYITEKGAVYGKMRVQVLSNQKATAGSNFVYKGSDAQSFQKRLIAIASGQLYIISLYFLPSFPEYMIYDAYIIYSLQRIPFPCSSPGRGLRVVSENKKYLYVACHNNCYSNSKSCLVLVQSINSTGWRIHVSVDCVIIGSDNGLSSLWCQAIIWTNGEILSIRP